MTSTAARLAGALLVVLGAAGARAAPRDADTGGAPGAAQVSDGAAISPEFAKTLFERVTALRESDGCRLAVFDTARFRITIGLLAPNGAAHSFELATAPALSRVDHRVGAWALAVPPDLRRDCGATLAAIEGVLRETAAPRGQVGLPDPRQANYALLAVSFLLLALGTALVLYREAKAHHPPVSALVALFGVSTAGLALRLFLSPRTFLHEYYHIAETVPSYLTGETVGTYGKTGPAIYRLVAAAFGGGDDVQLIFLTNALFAALAIPAIALLDLASARNWPRALAAALLLCVLPLHLRFSASELIFVPATTLAIWALALVALYMRTRRLFDALLAVLAISLTTQSRPEMLLFPAVVVAFVVLTEARGWRLLYAGRTLAALLVLVALLIPRAIELREALAAAPGPKPAPPDLDRFLRGLVFLQRDVTPPLYWILSLAGLAWGLLRKPGLMAWVAIVYGGFALFSLSLFDNRIYNLRSQLLSTSLVVLVAAGAAPLWLALWGERRRRAAVLVGGLGALLAALLVVLRAAPFVTELRDQQLEYAFLERTAARLPDEATLLTAVDMGGRNLDAFPEFLLRREGKNYHLLDVRRAHGGAVAWPEPGGDLLYYQGMFCYFAFDDEPPPVPMTAPCQAVHARYALEPLYVEDLDTEGYSTMRYAPGPFRIGFYRLRERP